mgnify:CR=1 FL=1
MVRVAYVYTREEEEELAGGGGKRGPRGDIASRVADDDNILFRRIN